MATNQDKDQSKDQGNKQGGKSGSQQSDTSKRGFASMDPEQQREIAAEGGRAAHEKGTAHEFTSEEARRAGSMSHKNDTRSSQSGSPGSASSSGGKAGSEEEDEDRGKGSRGGSSGGSGSKS
ncbi:MAG: KGG domain-containing protein [Pseudomonadota bacterium]|jgi:general stress protein YciG